MSGFFKIVKYQEVVAWYLPLHEEDPPTCATGDIWSCLSGFAFSLRRLSIVKFALQIFPFRRWLSCWIMPTVRQLSTGVVLGLGYPHNIITSLCSYRMFGVSDLSFGISFRMDMSVNQ
jgi:hypothetical protein